MAFNHVAALENETNKLHVKLTHGAGISTIIVDSKKATYRGTPVIRLSDELKKKFENIILFTYLGELKQVPKIIYT